MMHLCQLLLAAVTATLTALSATATTLDDSASPRQRVEAKPRWVYEGEDAIGAERIGRMVVEVQNLEIRLNTNAWRGRQARIYLTLPQAVPGIVSPEGMRAEWRARNRMLGGSVIPGGRTLVYDGPIEQSQTVEFFDFIIHLDARYTQRGIRFEPKFEIEPR